MVLVDDEVAGAKVGEALQRSARRGGARPGTPAARMPQLKRETVKARAARLRQAAEERRSRWLDSQVGTRPTVLIENSEKGHSVGFVPVRIADSKRGELGTARITDREQGSLIGIFE